MLNFITVDSWASFLSIYPSYFLAAFVMPLIYGSWRLTAYHFVVGPRLAMLLTSNPNEVAAIWCLLSIGILLLVVKTPLRRFMFVKTWWLWPKKSSRSVATYDPIFLARMRKALNDRIPQALGPREKRLKIIIARTNLRLCLLTGKPAR